MGEKGFENNECLEKISEARLVIELPHTSMNSTSLSSSPGVAADLSQRSTTSSNPVLHREDSLNKVYPHLIFSSQLQADRNIQQEQGIDVRGRLPAPAQTSPENEKEEKRTNLTNFKRSTWENVDSNSTFTETHKSYDAPFYYDSHSPRVPQLPTSPYDINPLLLKDPTVPLKHDRTIHHSAMTLPWEKNAAALIGSMYQPPQKPRLVNSKSSPADLEDVSKVYFFMVLSVQKMRNCHLLASFSHLATRR